MVYIGRIGGPRTSDILRSKVGAAALGLEPHELDAEWEESAEASGSVMPVYVDEDGYAFYLFHGNKTIVYWLSASEIDQLGTTYKSMRKDLPKEYEEIRG